MLHSCKFFPSPTLLSPLKQRLSSSILPIPARLSLLPPAATSFRLAQSYLQKPIRAFEVIVTESRNSGAETFFVSEGVCWSSFAVSDKVVTSFSPAGLIRHSLIQRRTHRFKQAVCVQCYASKSRARKQKNGDLPVMDEKDAFFVVRKGDVVGFYKTLKDCQTQVSSSICDPPVSVYKGYSLPKDATEYLASRGLQNALYTIKAADMKEELCGTLLPCPFQEPASANGCSFTTSLNHEETHGAMNPQNVSYCVLEFDGASKGNPGPAGAGVVLRAADGSVICKLRQGLGRTTNNVAEYKAIILGLTYASEKGYLSVLVKGDSKLVCMQIQGLWKARNENMAQLCAEVKRLMEKFRSFQITHVLRDFNSDADDQANLGVNLAESQIVEELHDVVAEGQVEEGLTAAIAW